MTAPELNAELRNLIDLRLDEIDRILLSVQVSYSERRHIVGEVESQVFELLGRRSEIPMREDVQAVLDSLDPAESYIPEELRGKPGNASSRPAARRSNGPRLSRLAVGCGILAAAVLLVGGLAVALQESYDKVEAGVITGFCLFAIMLGGIVAAVRILSSERQLRGLPFALFASLLLPIVLINFGIVTVMLATRDVIPWLITITGLLYLNYVGIRRFRRWIDARQGEIAILLRRAKSEIRAT